MKKQHNNFFKKNFMTLFVDGFQLPQGLSHFEVAVSSHLNLILSTLEIWEAESTIEPLSGFEKETPGLRIQHLNH